MDEDPEGMSTAIFTVRLRGGVRADEDITLPWRVTCADSMTGVASSVDFANSECPSGSVTIAAGETSVTFAVSTRDDELVEGDETFGVTFSNPRRQMAASPYRYRLLP